MPPSNRQTSDLASPILRMLVLTGLIAAPLLAYLLFVHFSPAPLVVYCAHDSIYAEKILREFERGTGIPVAIRFDTEATKSLGLVELLLRERDHPRCDVFWNNELLGTLELADAGVLLPYKGTGFTRMPAAVKDADGLWVGFAARLRVWILNTQHVGADEQAVAALVQHADLSRVAIAKPLYGTTRTHYTVLWHFWGADKLIAWHREWRQRGVREVAGNAMVKNLVAEGVCDAGLCDNDDFFEAKDDGKPVAMVPARLDNGATICIPNTVAIIRGTRRLAQAQQLVDYLLCADCELALANGRSRQIPLGPVDDQRLSADIRTLKRWAASAYPLTQLGAARPACLAWLKTENRQ